MEIKSYHLYQESCLKEIKKLGNINLKLHPAGGFDKNTGFIYEPIGDKKYLWKFKGYKDISEADYYAKIECSSCGTIIMIKGLKKSTKCNCGRIIKIEKMNIKLITDIENLNLEFIKFPLNEVLFKIPSQESIMYWKENNIKIDNKFLFKQIKNFFGTFYDLVFSERDLNILSIAVINSWFGEILDNTFYLSISGETGSGKTALLESIMMLSKHGLMVGSIKNAGISRSIDTFKLSIGIDEIDYKSSKEDEDLTGILRQGYRTKSPYIRVNSRSGIPEAFNIFGFKTFSFRSDIVDDLQNRCLSISLKKSNDKTLPVLNMFKGRFSPFELIFFWYIENINEIYLNSPCFDDKSINLKEMIDLGTTKSIEIALNTTKKVNEVNTVNNNNNNKDNNNNNIYIETRKGLVSGIKFLPNFVNLINQKTIFGRNNEISFIIYSIFQILNIDLDDWLFDVMEQKQDDETAQEEEGWLGVLKDTLKECYSSKIVREEMKFITYKYMIECFCFKMKQIYDLIPTQHQTKKLLRQIGFVDGLNKKVVKFDGKSRLCLIYDNDIKKNVGLEEETKFILN